MTYVDLALLNLTERFCQLFQRLTGKTNVWLAVQLTNLSIIVYFASAAAYFWVSDTAMRIGLVVFCAGLLYLLSQTVFKVSIETSENSAYGRVAKGLRNPRRLRDAPLRIVFLTLAIVIPAPASFVYLTLQGQIPYLGLFIPLTYSLIVLTTVVMYLLGCDPLPPCVGKVFEWLRGAAPARATEESLTRERTYLDGN